MKLGVVLPRLLANAAQNGGGILVHRQWVDERGNPASWKVVIAVNQPLIGADGQRDEERV
jgi:hypothetical protein